MTKDNILCTKEHWSFAENILGVDAFLIMKTGNYLLTDAIAGWQVAI